MKKPRTTRPKAIKARAAQTAAVISPDSPVAADASAKKKRSNPFQFFREVRAEGRKITWTSWKETWITSIMVFIMVVISGAFFLVADGVLHALIAAILNLSTPGA